MNECADIEKLVNTDGNVRFESNTHGRHVWQNIQDRYN